MTDTDKEYIEIDVREPLQARIDKLLGQGGQGGGEPAAAGRPCSGPRLSDICNSIFDNFYL